ncbi:MAG: 50S ribosomal protein L29 [Nitrospirota bacterium]|nr:50S ribosomal protein L29 [Nitrospirota bacterium]MDH5587324.1 50S ribosomal protein L29 [Nitrospirota bacterium]MDH5774305.1 50S ribosomal protein L29 [Nitrospirota bacterium]
MDLDQLRNLEKTELSEKIAQLKQELFHFRSQLAMGRMENPMKIREAKRNIARVHTIIRQKV